MNHGHGGNKESNLVTETTMSANDFVRIITSGSRKITLQNFATAIFPLLDVLNLNAANIKTITSNYGLILTDKVILSDSTSADLTVNLMTATAAFNVDTSQGSSFTVKKIDGSANKVIVSPPGSELIDGEPSIELIGIDRPFIHFISDGSNWWTV